MKFIFNGNLLDETTAVFDVQNRGFRLGDFIAEPIKIANQKALYAEEHYFNLMASMRIFRMKIPIEFTQEFFEEQIQTLLEANAVEHAKIQISVYRNLDHGIDITRASVAYLIEIVKVFSENAPLNWYNAAAEIDVFRDLTVNTDFFAQLNTHKPEDIIVQAFMQENDLEDMVLLNGAKRMARSVLGSPFLIQGNTIKTPKITEGGIRNVTRNQLCKWLQRNPNYALEETEIFPFEMQKSDEMFICIAGDGIQSIHQNRKKSYTTSLTEELLVAFEKD